MHYKRQHYGRPVLAPRRSRGTTITTCPICGAQWCRLPGNKSKRATCSQACQRTLLSQTQRERRLAQANTARDGQILALVHEGLLYRQIAARYGITEARIRQIANAAGVYRRPRPERH